MLLFPWKLHLRTGKLENAVRRNGKANSSIQFETGTFGKQPEDVRKYFSDYVQKCKKDGMEVYLLEYTKDKKLIRRIKQYCRKNKFHYYISDSIELD